MEKNLNLFPQFLVRYPDNGIKNEEDKPISISEDDFELSALCNRFFIACNEYFASNSAKSGSCY